MILSLAILLCAMFMLFAPETMAADLQITPHAVRGSLLVSYKEIKGGERCSLPFVCVSVRKYAIIKITAAESISSDVFRLPRGR